MEINLIHYAFSLLVVLFIYYWKCPEIWDFSSNVSFLAPKLTKMLKYAKIITFIKSIKHMLVEYDEQICFEDRAEFHPSWPYSFVVLLYFLLQIIITKYYRVLLFYFLRHILYINIIYNHIPVIKINNINTKSVKRKITLSNILSWLQ